MFTFFYLSFIRSFDSLKASCHFELFFDVRFNSETYIELSLRDVKFESIQVIRLLQEKTLQFRIHINYDLIYRDAHSLSISNKDISRHYRQSNSKKTTSHIDVFGKTQRPTPPSLGEVGNSVEGGSLSRRKHSLGKLLCGHRSSVTQPLKPRSKQQIEGYSAQSGRERKTRNAKDELANRCTKLDKIGFFFCEQTMGHMRQKIIF